MEQMRCFHQRSHCRRGHSERKACNSANTACNLRRDNAFTAENPANHAICTTLQFDGTPIEQQKVYSFARSRKTADDWTGSVLHPSLVRVHSVKDQELCGKIALFLYGHERKSLQKRITKLLPKNARPKSTNPPPPILCTTSNTQ